ncbi:MAG: tellurite resistance TerB family protein [Gammaproteobacteria bacterium]|nr:tellurite resistance TerB family protein [Gammaproteobacteria bacterium]
MSLVKTLGKLAVGALVAKGVGKVVQNKMGGAGRSGGATQANQGDLGGLLGGLLGGASGGGGAGGGMGELLGGSSSGGAGGGLGGLLESLGGAAGQSGGQGSGQSGGIGDLLNSVLREGQTPVEPTPTQNQQAEVMLKAMLNAAKCDGQLDDAEKQKIMKNLDDVTAEDMAFIKRELAAPVDAQGFIKSVPRGMEQQVYLMSLMAIDLDSKAEADYLDTLAKGMGISEQASNQIHQKLGVPTLYT